MEPGRALVGVGLYTVPEAARLVNVPARTLRRWTTGYTFARGRSSGPLFQRDLADRTRQPILTFQDLIELLLVRQFRRAGWSLQRIREEEKRAAERFKINHPFAAKKVLTDGHYWFTEEEPVIGEDGRVHRVIQKQPSRQLVFTQFVLPFLKNLDYEGDEPSSYWPLGKGQRIIIDRSRAFGKPIDNETGVPTRALYDMHAAGDSIEEVARWFHVSPEAVRAAVAYEEQLRRA
jgi:uncharacterized protein (DUF433 family)